MPERWILPAVIMTLGSYAVAFLLPRWTGMPSPASNLAPVLGFWVSMIVGFVALLAAWRLVFILLRREPRPIEGLRRIFPATMLLAVAVGGVLSALNLTAFGLIKPQLGHLVAFSADPFLANFDSFLFLGEDGWRRLAWLHHPGLPQIYHQGWFGWVFFSLFHVLSRRTSDERDALLVSYFGLWSVFGPLVHLSMPAAGPVFWQELGMGSRFAALPMAEQTALAKQYLWDGYVHKAYNAAGGISAMPSLHLATMGWATVAFRRTRLFWPSALFTLYILAASVAIGWHYVIDGIVGLIGAVFCFAACKSLLGASNRRLVRKRV